MIRFAVENDIPAIMEFIDTYWKKGHILGVNESFFRYEHDLCEEVSYVISTDNHEQIEAIIGYIPYGKTNRDAMTVMWKANHTEDPFLGVKLLQYLADNGSIRIIASSGINVKTVGIYQYLGYTTGIMTQWYRLNKKPGYVIAKVENDEIPIVKHECQLPLVELPTFTDLLRVFSFADYAARNPKPCKEEWYVKKRYFMHPIYRYRVFAVVNSVGNADTILVFREQEQSGAKVLRMIDCLGDFCKIGRVTLAIDRLLEQDDMEYVDCYEAGLCADLFLNAGWRQVKDSGNIIPNYFFPYVQQNIDIRYFTSDPEIVLFKGDGDQDRPS